jgi:uncharacterized protein (TIGR03382 family)
MRARHVLAVVIALAAGACIDHVDASPDAKAPDDASTEPKVGCDGALCQTSNDSTCNAGGSPGWLAAAFVAFAVAGRRRRPVTTLAIVVVAGLLAAPRVAAADGSGSAGAAPPVDVHLAAQPPVERHVTIAWNPLPFIVGLGKLSVDIVWVPRHHSALVVAPFLAITDTAPITVYADNGTPTQLPQQDFTTLGVELGYRHYWGAQGPRGLFVGPSLILADVLEHQGMFGNGSKTSYADLGLAFDVGYQMLVTSSFSLAVGAGVQGQLTTMSVPKQQFPADVYANSGVWPRILLSVGYAF